MFRAIGRNIQREPVRWFSSLIALVPITVTGILLFSHWNPTEEQLSYVLSTPTGILGVLGWTVVREAVTPNTKLPPSTTASVAVDQAIEDSSGPVT